jgi:hypothetical protein
MLSPPVTSSMGIALGVAAALAYFSVLVAALLAGRVR